MGISGVVLFIYLFIYLFIHLGLFVCLFVYLFVYSFINLFVYLSFNLSFRQIKDKNKQTTCISFMLSELKNKPELIVECIR